MLLQSVKFFLLLRRDENILLFVSVLLRKDKDVLLISIFLWDWRVIAVSYILADIGFACFNQMIIGTRKFVGID